MLMNNQLEMTACRLFRIDYALLFSVSVKLWTSRN
jgi:hypothetical protein